MRQTIYLRIGKGARGYHITAHNSPPKRPCVSGYPKRGIATVIVGINLKLDDAHFKEPTIMLNADIKAPMPLEASIEEVPLEVKPE